jgi:uncharacterized protein YjiS (DUF1127 family)
MIMSTISETAGARQNAACDFFARTLSGLKQAWDAYHAWRIREATIACLKSLSDRQLEDIGLTRAQIGCVVRGAITTRPKSFVTAEDRHGDGN